MMVMIQYSAIQYSMMMHASNNVDDSYSDVSSSISFVNINCSHVANDSANNGLIDKDDVPYFTLDAVLAMCIAESSSN